MKLTYVPYDIFDGPGVELACLTVFVLLYNKKIVFLYITVKILSRIKRL